MAACLIHRSSLTECNTGTTKKLSFGVNTTIELKKYNTSDNTGTLRSRNIAHCMPLLSNVGTIVVLTPKGRFLYCATVAFSERQSVLPPGYDVYAGRFGLWAVAYPPQQVR